MPSTCNWYLTPGVRKCLVLEAFQACAYPSSLTGKTMFTRSISAGHGDPQGTNYHFRIGQNEDFLSLVDFFNDQDTAKRPPKNNGYRKNSMVSFQEFKIGSQSLENGAIKDRPRSSCPLGN